MYSLKNLFVVGVFIFGAFVIGLMAGQDVLTYRIETELLQQCNSPKNQHERRTNGGLCVMTVSAQVSGSGKNLHIHRWWDFETLK